MIGVTLKHLRYFAALARREHFGDAASDCGISQPALSQQMREFEAQLGASLIERGGRRIRLTPLGREIAARAQAILQAVDDLRDLARGSTGPMGGRLRLGIIPTVAPYLLPAIMKEAVTQLPDLSLQPLEARTSRLIAELGDGRLDAAIVALPISEPGLHEERLFAEEFMLVRHRTDASEPAPSSERLRTMRLLLLEEGHCFRDQALAFCDLSGPEATRELMEGSSLTTLVQMVGAGLGVTLIPQMAVAQEARTADVSVAALPHPRPSRTLGLIWRRTTPMAEPLRKFAKVLLDAHARASMGANLRTNTD
ncbi:hydrogen peroxide-inducible genes activator [Paracoccus sp. TK19116]|uniref:Hydrogen peroxide-inducible genes activator n=1 Tax=Paracoccus albicereus TaxID=2922394 RepID=A0ABT1MQF4_9RHOB|nr:hydrogen peroxide-inducible genes activator [Paracoccus albicereus]MCQ0970359.1 hydrogen peroxide-inducible genes activator [Paracoccus albicereus]